EGNFVWSPGKFVVAVGVHNLVVVETPDALLICPRDRAQDVAKIVKRLEEEHRKKLLLQANLAVLNANPSRILTSMSSIKFGTDGWRGVIAEDFTFANARIVANAFA